MSTTETPAPVSTETAAATTEVVAANGSATTSDSDWTAALDEETRATAQAKGWKGVGDVAKAYVHSQRSYADLQSKALTLPTDDAKPEDWDAFYGKLGRPEKAEGYEFKLPEGLPENLPYDAMSADKFKNWAHQAGISPKQAGILHDAFVTDAAAQYGAMQEASEKAAKDAHGMLVKSWGDPETDGYKRNQELANRTLRQQGGTELIDELKGIGALGPNGEVKSPRLALALAKIGESLYAEDTLFGGPATGVNPFSDKTENLTEQGKMIASNPDRARVLIRQAGKNPAEWQL